MITDKNPTLSYFEGQQPSSILTLTHDKKNNNPKVGIFLVTVKQNFNKILVVPQIFTSNSL